MPGRPQVGWVRISSTDPPLRVVARLSDEQPRIESGYGGWEEVARPRRPPITTFKSLPGIRLTLPILFDHWVSGVSIERQIADLSRMGRPTASDGEPPQVRVTATGGHIPYQARRWVITELAFGDALMNDKGNRVRQQVTVSLLEYVEDVYLTQTSASARQRLKAVEAKTKSGAAKKRVSVSRRPARTAKPKYVVGGGEFGTGETLVRIAARELGDATRWIEIAQLNNLRDPRATTTGTVIRLP
jgi:hypothetical protein